MNVLSLSELFPEVRPQSTPVLDPAFTPAVLINRAFRGAAKASGQPVPVRLALEQADGSVFHYLTEVLPAAHPKAAANFPYLERLCKFLLWSRGGYRFYFDGPCELGEMLKRYFEATPTGRFDAELMGQRVYEKPFSVVITTDLPGERAATTPLGRRLDGCRIGFDLGGSDRKVAAVVDGEVRFSEETTWDPYHQPDPQYHFDGIMESLRKAAAHMPKVEAIGGSAAGVYVNNQVKVASLFRGVPPDMFQKRVKGLFFEVQKAWNGVPLEVVNDGEVTALAGSMSLGVNGVLGIALGTSQAGGYVNNEGNITSWLNELAFVPVDYAAQAPRDEWSGDVGCGAQYFSQQAVGRLLEPAGISLPRDMSLADKLKAVQQLMDKQDVRARRIFETIGVYLGYAVAHYAEFYPFRHVLILGRVTSGPGGDIIRSVAQRLITTEFKQLAQQIAFHVPDEKDKRHGQAIAAASLPAIPRPAISA
jgi:predicted NBD/HSP70 family sugar kinase